MWLYISKQWFNFKSNNQDVQNPGWLHNKSAYALCAQALKGIVMPKINICWKCTHPQAIRNVEEFGSSWEQIWRNVALHHLLINRTSAVNGCRQKESKLIKHHNNPHQSSASVLRSEKLHVCKKQIHHLGILNSHSDGTHSLQLGTDEQTNTSTARMAWGWVHFNFGVKFSLKETSFADSEMINSSIFLSF